jgi:hypothetical protein
LFWGFAPFGESLKDALQGRKTDVTFIQEPPEPGRLRSQYDGTRNQEKGSRHDRKKQSSDASKYENQPEADDRAASDYFMNLRGIGFLHKKETKVSTEITFSRSIQMKVMGAHPAGAVFRGPDLAT